MNKQMSLSGLSDELAQVQTKKKEFLERYDRRLLCEFLRHLRELQKSPGERIASPGRKKKLKIGIDKKGSLC